MRSVFLIVIEVRTGERSHETIGLLFILVCAISWCAPAQEAGEGGKGATIRALERAWVYAQSRNDNRALNQIFDNSPGVHRVRAPAEQVGIPGEGTDGSATSGAGLDGPNDGARIWDHRYRSWDLQGKGSEKWQALRKALALHRYLGIQKGKLGAGCGRCGTHNALSRRLQSDEPVLSL